MARTRLTEAVFMDSALSYDGSPATVFSGLDHLKGLAVSILADGDVVSGKTVANDGTVTLDHSASVVHIGLPVKAKLKTLQLEYDSQGTSQGKKKKHAHVFVRMEDTRALLIGTDETHVSEMKFRQGEDLSETVPMFTGDKKINIEPRWNADGQLYVEQNDPLPVTILALIPETETSETG